MDKAEQPTITRADRSAAWPYRPSCYETGAKSMWMTGIYDNVAPIIKAFARHRTTSLAAQDGLDEHFPTGLRQRPMRLATTDEVFEGPVFCDCYCGESFAGSDEQEVRQLWAEHALSAIKEQHHD